MAAFPLANLGSNNTYLCYKAGLLNTTGSYNTFIGRVPDFVIMEVGMYSLVDLQGIASLVSTRFT